MVTEEIREELFRLQDMDYRDFQSKLIPNIDKNTMIGVRTPALRKYAKELMKRDDYNVFLLAAPHSFFDENQLHAFLVSEIKDFWKCMEEIKRFLPYVDNWATCDQMSPKAFKKNRMELLKNIREWITSGHTYTVRFAVGMLMQHFLDSDFDPEYLSLVSGIRSGEYYINMMVAWYFATALAKQYKETLPYLEQGRLSPWTHKKAIQKALESFRITPEQKNYLKTLKIQTKP